MDKREQKHSNSVLLSPPTPQQATEIIDDLLAVDSNHYDEMAVVIAYLRDINDDLHAIRVEIDAAKEAVRKSKNPIIKGLFPWL